MAKAKPKAKTGRPSSYRPEYATQAAKLCLLGATDPELANFFGVARSTLNGWKGAHPEFLDALKSGKAIADGNVAASLYRRAMGYEHKAVKIFADTKTQTKLVVDYVERYPPDTTACIFWLKNRQPDQWRDRQEERQPDAQDTARQIRDALARMADADGLPDGSTDVTGTRVGKAAA